MELVHQPYCNVTIWNVTSGSLRQVGLARKNLHNRPEDLLNSSFMSHGSQSNKVETGSAGPLRALAWIRKLTLLFKDMVNSAPDRVFDRLLNVSTRDVVIRDGSVFTGGENCTYDGSQWLSVRRALKDLAPAPSDVFVDLGSGKGKALLIAGRLPYSRVIGVEIDDELSEHARQNIRQARSRLCAQDVKSVTASVLDWPIPDEASVIFMFNPFIGQTFRAVVDRIIESYDRRPRTLHIVYLYPWEHDWLLSTGRVVVDNVRPGNWLVRPGWWRSGYVIVCYRVLAAPAVSRSSPIPRSMIRSDRAIRYWSRPNGYRFTMSATGWDTLYSRS
jgi:SAM-dependent methyltransferase